MTLAATDEFWNSPIPADLDDDDAPTTDSAWGPSAAPADIELELEPRDSPTSSSVNVMPIPVAHHQLLCEDTASIEDLKGYDHTRDVFRYEDSDSYDVSKPEGDSGGSSSSWLLGFACLADEAKTMPERGDGDGLIEVPSRMSLDSDECSSGESDDDDSSIPGDSVRSAPESTPRSKGVSFSSSVRVQPIPHSSTLSLVQRRKMFSTSFEVRQNKTRNKREYRYEGYNWRNVTEEWEMGVDMVTGELVHPAHDVL